MSREKFSYSEEIAKVLQVAHIDMYGLFLFFLSMVMIVLSNHFCTASMKKIYNCIFSNTVFIQIVFEFKNRTIWFSVI